MDCQEKKCSRSPVAHEPDDRAGTRDAGPDANGLVALRLWEGGGQQRQRRGHDERRADARHRARDDDLDRAVEISPARSTRSQRWPGRRAERRGARTDRRARPQAAAGMPAPSVYPSTIQVSCVCVAEVATAMSGSAAFRATIEEMTSSTSRAATVSNQYRPNLERVAKFASIFWSDSASVSTMFRSLSAELVLRLTVL